MPLCPECGSYNQTWDCPNCFRASDALKEFEEEDD